MNTSCVDDGIYFKSIAWMLGIVKNIILPPLLYDEFSEEIYRFWRVVCFTVPGIRNQK